MSEVYGMVAVMQAAKDGRLSKRGLSAGDLAVLLVMADYAGPNNRAWPGMPAVASAAQCSQGAARRSVDALTKLGILVELAPATSKTGVTYSIVLPAEAVQGEAAMPKRPPPQSKASHGGRPPMVEGQASHSGGSRPPTVEADPLMEPLTESPRGTRSRTKPPGKASKGKKPKLPSNPRHHELMTTWLTLAESAYGVKPATGGNAYASLGYCVSKLLGAYNNDADAVLACMRRAVGDGRKPDIKAVATNPDRYAPFAAKPARGAPRQPDEPDVSEWEQAS